MEIYLRKIEKGNHKDIFQKILKFKVESGGNKQTKKTTKTDIPLKRSS